MGLSAVSFTLEFACNVDSQFRECKSAIERLSVYRNLRNRLRSAGHYIAINAEAIQTAVILLHSLRREVRCNQNHRRHHIAER